MRGHVPGLDGLRGLAVIGVLLFHDRARLRGGYLGVDLFFVLSGYLITSILVREHEARGTIDLKAFWIRRARRLLPALLSLVPAIALYARTFAAPEELAPLRADALATLAYVANWRAILAKRSYWEMFTAPSPLEHTWSLAIEEQFYVVWPLLVLAVLGLARGRVRALFAACVLLGLASCAAMLLLYDGGGDTVRVYLGTDTRGAAILAGAALATSRFASGRADGPAPRWLDGAGALAALVLGVAWWSLDGQSELLYRGGFWATELACVVLVACCVRLPGGVVARALAWAPLRAMGAISYGVYLWHWPIYVVLSEERTRLGGLALLALRLACTLAIAGASYRWLESPIRARGLAWGRPLVIVPGAFALAVAAVMLSTRAVAAKPLVNPIEERPRPIASTEADGAPEPVPPSGMLPPASALPKGTMRVLVLGDSVGLALGARLFWSQSSANAFVAHRAVGDCSILDGVVPVHAMGGYGHGNGNCASSWVDDVRELRPDVTLIVLGGAYFSLVKSAGKWGSPCDRGWHDAYAKRLAELLDAIAPFTARRVVTLAAYPVGKWQMYRPDAKVDCYNAILREAATTAKAEILDLGAWACPAHVCTLTSQDQPVRPDGLHFDGLGADETCRWVLGELRKGEPARDE